MLSCSIRCRTPALGVRAATKSWSRCCSPRLTYRSWRGCGSGRYGPATTDQKRRAAAAYGRYIGAVYATQFDDYAGQRFQVLGEQQIKHGTLVRTQMIKADGEPVSINYVVYDNDTAWQIGDVYLSGTISELATRRSEFAAILRTTGIDGLIASLKKKADDLQI